MSAGRAAPTSSTVARPGVLGEVQHREVARGHRDHRRGRGRRGRTVRAAGHRQQQVVRAGPLVVVRVRRRGRHVARHRGHDLLDGLPVALRERRALALAVVGERPRSRSGGAAPCREPLQRAEHPVEALQRPHRLGPGRAGVVGDLVVVDEVAVDRPGRRGPSARRSSDDVEVAQQHVGDRPQQRTYAPARCTRGCTLRRRCRRAWCSSLTISPTDRTSAAGEAVRAGARTPASRARRGPAAATVAHGQQARRGVAGEDVADADAAVGEQAPAGRDAGLDHRGVRGPVGDHQPAGVLLVPAERRHLLGCAVQDARPGWPGWSPASRCASRTSVWLPARSQLAERRQVAGPDRPRAAAARTARRAARTAPPGRSPAGHGCAVPSAAASGRGTRRRCRRRRAS